VAQVTPFATHDAQHPGRDHYSTRKLT
jgi:hypothetical protein